MFARSSWLIRRVVPHASHIAPAPLGKARSAIRTWTFDTLAISDNCCNSVVTGSRPLSRYRLRSRSMTALTRFADHSLLTCLCWFWLTICFQWCLADKEFQLATLATDQLDVVKLVRL